eukprot:Seg287.7 transcript_id=Seg287.7/GoldUCD/mRNA.D3Y31 product="hypothetical protein" protein_id=Seg287.7/GoldUCD/D3Y31
MAVIVYVLRIIAAILITFLIKKSSFVSCNSTCYSVYPSDATDTNETFICSSIWLYKENHGLRLRPKHGLKILLILAGDVEIFPGPANKCCSCQKTIRKNQTQLSCDSCKGNFHSKCLTDKFNGHGESYYCKNCDAGSIADVNDDFNNDTDSQTNKELKQDLQSRGLKIFHQNVNGLYLKIDKLRICLKKQ